MGWGDVLQATGCPSAEKYLDGSKVGTLATLVHLGSALHSHRTAAEQSNMALQIGQPRRPGIAHGGSQGIQAHIKF